MTQNEILEQILLELQRMNTSLDNLVQIIWNNS